MLSHEEEHTTRLRLELALEASGLVDWDFDYEKNTAHRSLRHDQLYGYTEMLPQWNFDNFFHHVLPAYHEKIKNQFGEVLQNTGKINFEFQIRRVDGDIRWLHLTGKAHRDEAGKILRVAGILKDITEDKTSTETLSIQTQNIASLFEKAPEFLCVISSHHFIYEYVNPAHVALFNGVNMTGHSVIEDQKEIDGEKYITMLQKVIDTGESVFYKDSPAQIGARLRYLDMIYAPRRNNRGEVDGVYALGSDVTDKILALRAAQMSEDKMKLITNKLPAFISYTDNDGRYQFMNAMYEKWFNKPIEEMLGKTRDEITPPEYAIQSKTFQSGALGGQASHHQGIIRKANGDYLNLDIHFVPDIDPVTKAVRGMIAVGVDVTQQTKSLREAELARKELHEVFMQAPAPMCLLTGPDHIFTMANPHYIELVKRDVLGKKHDDVFAGDDVSFYKSVIDQVYKTGEPYIVTQSPLELVDDKGLVSKRYINVGYHAYKDFDGSVKGVLVIVLDVTDQVNSVIVRDNFMGIASHELKTPLTSLKLQNQMNKKTLELSSAEYFNQARLEKIFQAIGGQIDRLIRLVDDMLDISRITVDKLEMNFTQANLSKLVSDVFENFRPQIRNAGIELSLKLDDQVILDMDEARIEQVITNIITNFMKYASHRPVDVVLKKNEKAAILSVRDHGKGIDGKFFEKIFERFERIDSSRDVSGLGIGLYVSKKIALAHHGKISVESELGQGSTFTLELPL